MRRAVVGVVSLTLSAACSGSGDDGDGSQTATEVGESRNSLFSYNGAPITTQHSSPERWGATAEQATTSLTHAIVGGADFGKVYGKTVRGAAYAQPLYLPQIPGMPGASGPKNVVYVATMHNTIYAFDADNPAANPFWVMPLNAFGGSIKIPDSEFVGAGLPGTDYRDIWGEVGILSTPVIDYSAATPGNSVMYVVATSKNKTTNVYRHDLYKINAVTGTVLNSVQITNGDPMFSKRHSQRSSLLLQQQGGTKVVFMGFGGYADRSPYGGHIFAFNAATLAQIAMHQTTRGLGEGGVWMAGQGIMGDGTDIYFVTGNGDHEWDQADPDNINKLKLGQSVVKMRLTGGTFSVQSWFSPHNQEVLSLLDGDVGAAGVTQVPGKTFLVAGGKEGVMYVLNKTNLGHYNASVSDPNIQQRFRIQQKPSGCGISGSEHDYVGLKCNHVHGSPVFFTDDSPAPKLRMYLWAENDTIRGFEWNDLTQRFNCGGLDPCDQSLILKPPAPTGTQFDGKGVYGMPGGMLSVSSTGATNGIIWATHAANSPNTTTQVDDVEEDGGQSTVDGVLVAYNAKTLTELWNSEKNPARDDLGAFVKFAPPTPTGGQVYTSANNGVANKVIVTTNTTDRGPAIGVRGAGATGEIVYAFKTKGSSGAAGAIKVLNSTSNDGRTFSPVTTLAAYTTKYEPAVVGDGASNRIYLAFTDSTNGKVKVVRSGASNFAAPQTIATPSSDATNAGPALAFGNNRVFVAWKEQLLGLLRVASVDVSNPANVTFGAQVNLGEGSDTTPALYYSGTRLYLVWRGPDGNLNVTWSGNDGATWPSGNKTIYSYAAGSGPSLMGLPVSSVGGNVTDLYLVYSNDNSIANKNLALMTAENSDPTKFGYEHRLFNIETNRKPSTTIHDGKAYVAYTDYQSRPWIGRYSPGELAVYGRIK